MSLQSYLRHRHVEVLIEDAETIRTWPDAAERMNAATRYIHQAMYERAIGRITAAELQQVTRLISFAIEPVEPPPLEELWLQLLTL